MVGRKQAKVVDDAENERKELAVTWLRVQLKSMTSFLAGMSLSFFFQRPDTAGSAANTRLQFYFSCNTVAGLKPQA